MNFLLVKSAAYAGGNEVDTQDSEAALIFERYAASLSESLTGRGFAVRLTKGFTIDNKPGEATIC